MVWVTVTVNHIYASVTLSNLTNHNAGLTITIHKRKTIKNKLGRKKPKLPGLNLINIILLISIA